MVMAKKSQSRSRKSRKEKVLEQQEYEEQISITSNIGNKIIVTLAVLCILGLFYLLAIYITNKHANDGNESNEAQTTETSTDSSNKSTTGSSISYDEILVGRSLSMSDDNYLVLFYDSSNEDVSSTYSELISNYKNKEEHLPIYYVDMSNTFNKAFAKEEANYNPTNESEISINGPTLINVVNSQVLEYLEGEEAISSYLS